MINYWPQSFVLIQTRKIFGRQLRGFDEREIFAPLRSLTSRAVSSLDAKACSTRLICRLCGTYAIPPWMYTFRWPTRSGTVYHGTLNQLSLLKASSLFPVVHRQAFNCSASLAFSASSTSCQSNASDRRKAARSVTSSVSKRCRKRATSDRTNRALKSGLHTAVSLRDRARVDVHHLLLKARRNTQCPISSFLRSSSRLTLRAVLLLSGRCCLRYVAIAEESWA